MNRALRQGCAAFATWSAFAVAVSVPAPAHAQELPRGEDLSISVVTFGRGDKVHQYFGHNAFVVSAPALPPTVFNYGMFTFGPDMVPNFLKGRLRFWVGTSDLRRTQAFYASENRDVRLRELNLEPQARLSIWRQLLHDVRPENREYLYDHYRDNCSTRLRDALDRALGGQLRRTWSAPARFTLRQETRRYSQHNPWVEWFMMFGLSNAVDHPQSLWADAFLPDQLEHLLDTTQYTNSRGERVSLVARKHDAFRAKRAAVLAVPTTRWPVTLALGMLLGAIPLVLMRGMRQSSRALWRMGFAAFAAVYGVVAGALGTLLTYLAFWSDHLVSHGNLNLLFANPLLLLAGVLAVGVAWRSPAAERVLYPLWVVIGVSTLCVFVLDGLASPAQDVTLTATLFAPVNLSFAFAMWSLRGSTLRANDRAAQNPALSALPD